MFKELKCKNCNETSLHVCYPIVIKGLLKEPKMWAAIFFMVGVLNGLIKLIGG